MFSPLNTRIVRGRRLRVSGRHRTYRRGCLEISLQSLSTGVRIDYSYSGIGFATVVDLDIRPLLLLTACSGHTLTIRRNEHCVGCLRVTFSLDC